MLRISGEVPVFFLADDDGTKKDCCCSNHSISMDHLRQSNLRNLRLPQSRRVMVTGIGAISAAGIGYPLLWDALLNCRSGIAPITRFDTTGMDSRIAGEVKKFDPSRMIEQRMKPKRLSRQAQFAVMAGGEAVRDAKLTSKDLRGVRVAVVIGSAIGALEAITESALRMQEKGGKPRRSGNYQPR